MRVETKQAAQAVLAELRDFFADMPLDIDVSDFEEKEVCSGLKSARVGIRVGKSRDIMVLIHDRSDK